MKTSCQILEIQTSHIFTRDDVARWYGIKGSGLRARLRKANLGIKNRMLTLKDIKTIFDAFSVPQECPNDIIFKLSSF